MGDWKELKNSNEWIVLPGASRKKVEMETGRQIVAQEGMDNGE